MKVLPPWSGDLAGLKPNGTVDDQCEEPCSQFERQVRETFAIADDIPAARADVVEFTGFPEGCGRRSGRTHLNERLNRAIRLCTDSVRFGPDHRPRRSRHGYQTEEWAEGWLGLDIFADSGLTLVPDTSTTEHWNSVPGVSPIGRGIPRLTAPRTCSPSCTAPQRLCLVPVAWAAVAAS